MPLKEIAVSPVGLKQEKTDEVKLYELDGNNENDSETCKQKHLEKTNSAFDEDPKDTTMTESKTSETMTSETKTLETKTSETKTSETKTSETKTSETKTSEAKTSEAKIQETKNSQDKKTIAMFTVSSQQKDTDTEDSSGKSQSSSRILSRNSSSHSSVSVLSLCNDICRICHCEGDEESPLITPCLCLGSLQHVHQACVQQWIKSSNTKACELCRFPFVMQTKLKPIGKWEKLDMTTSERRKIICSVSFHVIAITCVVWALYVLIDRTTAELQQSGGKTEWPFWTKLVVVAIGFTGGLVFMYVQCKVYLHLWRRLRAYNRVIYVQNCPPDERLKAKQAKVVTEAPQLPVEIIT